MQSWRGESSRVKSSLSHAVSAREWLSWDWYDGQECDFERRWMWAAFCGQSSSRLQQMPHYTATLHIGHTIAPNPHLSLFIRWVFLPFCVHMSYTDCIILIYHTYIYILMSPRTNIQKYIFYLCSFISISALVLAHPFLVLLFASLFRMHSAKVSSRISFPSRVDITLANIHKHLHRMF